MSKGFDGSRTPQQCLDCWGKMKHSSNSHYERRKNFEKEHAHLFQQSQSRAVWTHEEDAALYEAIEQSTTRSSPQAKARIKWDKVAELVQKSFPNKTRENCIRHHNDLMCKKPVYHATLKKAAAEIVL